SVGSWKTKPISPFGLPRLSSWLEGQSIAPELGSPRPAMIRSAVDLPQPDGPSRLRNSPRSTSSVRPLSASVPFENRFDTPRIDTMSRLSVPVRARGVSARERSFKIVSPVGRVRAGRPHSRIHVLLYEVHAEALAHEFGRIGLLDVDAGLEEPDLDHL